MKGKKEPMITYFLSRHSTREKLDGENSTNVRVIIKHSDSKQKMKARK